VLDQAKLELGDVAPEPVPADPGIRGIKECRHQHLAYASGMSGNEVDNGSAQDADAGLRGPGPSLSRSYGCASPSATPSHDLDVLTADPPGRLRPLGRPNRRTLH